MRTFTRCLVVMAALVALTVPAWSQPLPAPAAMVMTSSDSLVAIDRLARKIAVANPEYPDPYKVPIGVMIHVPTADGPKVYYKTEPWQLGQLGCFWHVAGYHLFGKRMMPPETTPPAAPVVKAGLDFDALAAMILAFLASVPWWVWALLAIGVGLAIANAVYQKRCERRRQEAEALEQARLEEERRMDYHNDTPVIAGGLADDPNQALSQIRAADALYHRDEPGRQVTGARHGTLRSTNGHERVALRVEHTGPNGLETADRWVNHGDRCTEVTVMLAGAEEPVIEYWLRHCGNRFGEIRDGRFTMPEGWEFVPTSPAATVPAATPETQAEAEPTSVGRRNGRAHQGDKFTAKIVITTNGGSTPKTKQVIDVTADRYVTQVALPDGATVHF